MEELNPAYRRLGRQVSDLAKNEDSLKLTATIQRHAKAALELEPRMMAELPETEQPKFIETYRARMALFIAEVEKLEAALKTDRNAEAVELYAGLKQMQAESHKEFRPRKMTFEEKAAEAARRTEEFNEQFNK